MTAVALGASVFFRRQTNDATIAFVPKRRLKKRIVLF